MKHLLICILLTCSTAWAQTEKQKFQAFFHLDSGECIVKTLLYTVHNTCDSLYKGLIAGNLPQFRAIGSDPAQWMFLDSACSEPADTVWVNLTGRNALTIGWRQKELLSVRQKRNKCDVSEGFGDYKKLVFKSTRDGSLRKMHMHTDKIQLVVNLQRRKYRLKVKGSGNFGHNRHKLDLDNKLVALFLYSQYNIRKQQKATSRWTGGF
jgi:hypothetical protein